ncbi:MerR family transcriptional regulator [Clostridium beijerinckii]|uniref:MerR family transcriptional regulator n=1 Tax=Clostridium beijerinckii TaxID=1520 RepID=A0AAW3W4E8_CLOBE|nr:MerR family transcriptional regulator [Clostridium beijerinckii]MBC2456100.1 MerR family transcriptional regulator [Clostridium beijerinckii]MBC2473647.1 MerR family transcriptional regulator [Clostridium beijerinckii]NOV62988.1 DNA-binding transcriptional MerR regulator [Clostridium beijerinckii]NOV70050.1 DNA-binding transcriptional MerR regulator [Clostridium beijerinckii]NOW31043.1 DNA-binding transcriptional MerR regulator [Clostridium beijerinckii]
MTYTIKDVSEILGLSIYTIRFYDKQGLLPFVARNKLGNREFTESDLNLFRVICCLKNSGMQIKDIKGYIDLCMEGAETIDPRRDLLVEHRKKIVKQIDSLKEKLELVDVKIERYEAPNAVELINEERRKAYEEKCENKLI